MRAIVITRSGGPEVLQLLARPAPEVGPGQVLVRVLACGVNRADILQRRGRYPAPAGVPSDIPGLEFAGVVERCGEGAQRFGLGERVMGLVSGGAYAEQVVAGEQELLPLPASFDFITAAAFPEAALTAHDSLFEQGTLQQGQVLLIHAVGSGVGLAALKLGVRSGARVVGTSRTESKLERARELGLHHGVPAGELWPEAVRALVPDGVHVVLDLAGGAYVEGDLKVLAPKGRVMVVGLMAGPQCKLDLGALLTKRATLIGTTLRSRTALEKAELVRSFERRWRADLDAGELTPVVQAVYPAARVAEAHALMEANDTFGKLVLTWE